MSFTPNNFFIGITDFFTVLLPGMVAAGVLAQQQKVKDFFEQHLLLQDAPQEAWWAVYFLGAYFLGHLIFALGSRLDEWIYEKVYERYWKENDQPLFDKVTEWRDNYITFLIGKKGRKTLNTYKWAEARLLMDYPAMASEVERLQAESKFFRSSAVVLLLYAVFSAFRLEFFIALLSLLVALVSLWIYMWRRHKAVVKAMQFVVTVETMPKKE